MKLIDVDLLFNAADAEYVFGTTGVRYKILNSIINLFKKLE